MSRHLTAGKVVVLIVNAAIVVYLVVLIVNAAIVVYLVVRVRQRRGEGSAEH